MEIRTLLENVAATWFIQQPEHIKQDWHTIKVQLIQNFAQQNITQTALQQLQSLKQQQHEPVAQFAVKLNQLFLRADPTMSEEMKLFFLWPRLRHDISRRVRDQGPTSFSNAIQIAQRIEASTTFEQQPSFPVNPFSAKTTLDNQPTPMDIDVQNLQKATRRALPDKDTQGRPKCFYCNNYGHVRKYCRKLKASQQIQHTQVTLADSASLVDLPRNE